MKLPPNAGKRLIAPAVVAALLVAVGGIAIVLSQPLLQKGRAEQAKAAADRQAAQNRLARTTDEEREIREKLVDYQKLRSRTDRRRRSGRLGRADRADQERTQALRPEVHDRAAAYGEMGRRDSARFGLATMCVGVGQGIAMVVKKA